MFEEMAPVLVTQVIIGIVAIVALLITNTINRKHTETLLRDEIKVKKQVEYLERQLSEFYGPITAILHSQGELKNKRFDPVTQTFTDLPYEIWETLRDEVMIPKAQEVADIIESKYHLIEGTEIPQSYRDYIVHARIWPIRIKHSIKAEDLPETFWFPKPFETDIYDTTRLLKEQYYELIEHLEEEDK